MNQGLDHDGALVSYFREDTVERARLDRIVQGHRERMNRRPLVLQADMATSLPDHNLTQAFQKSDDAPRRHTPREFHAASIGMSSSFT